MRIIWDFLRPPQDGLREVVGGELHRCNGGMEQIRVLSRDLNAINDSGAIKGMDAREDGVYITYSTGADTVTLWEFSPKLSRKKYSY